MVLDLGQMYSFDQKEEFKIEMEKVKGDISPEEFESVFEQAWEELQILKGVEKDLEPVEITDGKEPKYTLPTNLIQKMKSHGMDWLGDGSKRVAYYETGIPWIDEMHGMEKRTILTAPSNTGKTLLSIQIARSVSRIGKPVLYIDFETSFRDLWIRFITMGTSVTKEDLLINGKALLQDSKIKNQMNFNAHHLKNVDYPDLTGIENMENLTEYIDEWQKSKEEDGLVVIDQISGLKKLTQYPTQFEQTQRVADWIREDIKDKRWNLLALSPQNKANYGRKDVVVISGSAELINAVDSIWILTRKLDEEDRWDRRHVTLDVRKTRASTIKRDSFELVRNDRDEFIDTDLWKNPSNRPSPEATEQEIKQSLNVCE